MMEPNDPFSALCNLTFFVTNSSKLLQIGDSSLPQVSVFASLLSSFAETEFPALRCKVGAFSSPEFVRAVRNSSVRSLEVEGDDSWPHKLMLAVSESLCPGLQRLDLSDMYFGSKESRAFGSALERCGGELRSIILSDCYIRKKEEFIAAMRLAKNVESIRFRKVSLWDEYLAKLIDGIDELEELSLHDCNIGPMCTSAIGSKVCLSTLVLEGDSLKEPLLSELASGFRARGLKRLTLYNHDNEITGVAPLLERTPRLSSLKLLAGNFSMATVGKIGEAIRNSACAKTLRELDIESRLQDLNKARTFFAPLSGITGLTSLRVCSGKAEILGDMSYLIHILSQKTKKLGISASVITTEPAGLFAKVLLRASVISTLDLECNELGPEGAEAVIMALTSPGRSPMHMLNLSMCGIEDRGAEAVGRLIVSTGCRRILIPYDCINASGSSAIANSCERAAAEIEFLDLSGNPIEADGMKCIAERIVRANTAVGTLRLKKIEIGDETAETLARAIRERNREGPLRSLELHYLDFTEEGETALEEVQKLEHGINLTWQ